MLQKHQNLYQHLAQKDPKLFQALSQMEESSLQPQWKKQWDFQTRYEINDIVTYSDGAWICMKGNTNVLPGTVGDKYWIEFPFGKGGVGAAGPFQRTLLIKNATVGDNVTDHIIIYGAAIGQTSTLFRVVMVLRKAITADLTVRLKMYDGAAIHTLGTFTVPLAWVVNVPKVFGTFTYDTLPDISVVWGDITASDGSQAPDGIASLTMEWSGTGSSGGGGGGAVGLADPGVNGIVIRTAPNITTGRTLQAGTGITITNPDGVAGNPLISASGSSGLPDPGGNGIVVRAGAGTDINRTIVAGSAKITVANGDGVAGNPSIDLGSVAAANLSDGVTGTGAIVLASKLPASIAAVAKKYLISYDAATGLFVAQQPSDQDLTVTDNTVNNVSTAAHGFAPKLPNDATLYFNGIGGYTAPSGGGGSLVLEQHTASGSASLDFTAFISSTYDDYEIRITDLIAATNGASLRMRMGTGAGPSWDSAGNYNWVRFYRQINTGWTTSASNGAAADSGFSILILVSNTKPLEAVIRLSNPASAYSKNLHWKGTQLSSDGNQYANDGNGTYNPTTAVTGVQFLMSSGNIASGIVRVYGMSH